MGNKRHHRIDAHRTIILWSPPLLQQEDGVSIFEKVLFFFATPLLPDLCEVLWIKKVFFNILMSMRMLYNSHAYNKDNVDEGARESAGEDLALGQLAHRLLSGHPVFCQTREAFKIENLLSIDEAIHDPTKPLAWQNLDLA